MIASSQESSMSTCIAVWASVDEATIAELRDGHASESPSLSRLVRGGCGAADEHETPEAFYFRLLDAVHHAHVIVILGADGAHVRLQQKAEMYSFLAARIKGVHYEPDGSPSVVANWLGISADSEDIRTGTGDQGSFRVEPLRAQRHHQYLAGRSATTEGRRSRASAGAGRDLPESGRHESAALTGAA
jgi:hypothetical protein